MDWFPRRHVVSLARSSPGRLAYLEKTGIVVPQRVGQPPKTEVVYSWEQILEIRAISRLRQHLSFQTIRKILQYFEDHGFGRSLRDKQFLITCHSVSWVRSAPRVAPQIVQLTSRNSHPMGQYLLTFLDTTEALEPANLPVLTSPDLANVVDLEAFRQKIRPQ
jgi:DNA-binding transcriptional MerR regulator